MPGTRLMDLCQQNARRQVRQREEDAAEFLGDLRFALLRRAGVAPRRAIELLMDLERVDELARHGEIPIPRWPWSRATVHALARELAA